jgi:hypothetical protein
MNWLFKRTRHTNEQAEASDRLLIAKASAAHHRIEAQRFRDFAARAMVDAENSDRLARMYEARLADAHSIGEDGGEDPMDWQFDLALPHATQ